MSAWRTLLIAALCLLSSLPAREAVSAPTVDVTATARLTEEIVEVNEAFIVELKLSFQGRRRPEAPRLEVPPGFTLAQPSISTGFRTVFGTGRATQLTQTYQVRWMVSAGLRGRFNISPPSVEVGGRRIVGTGKLAVEVVAVGSKPKRRRSDPFGGFGGFFNPGRGADPFADFDLPPLQPRVESSGRTLVLDSAPQPHVFLRIVADRDKVVVGQQVSLSFYIYSDASLARGRGGLLAEFHDKREPSLSDFLRIPIDEDVGRGIVTRVGGKIFKAKSIGEMAVFPLRSGELATGRLSGNFQAPGVSRAMIPRESNEVIVHVREPPMLGRPVGYQLGDVGRFRLQAKVEPRVVTVGDALSVNVRLTGTGALPSVLRLPERSGITWLQPTKSEEINVRRGRVGGTRSFAYPVRFTKPGVVELGVVELPYYDPDRGRYAVASVALGKVTVVAGKDSPLTVALPDGVVDDDPLAGAPTPRLRLGSYAAPERRVFDPRLLSFLVLAAPAAVVLSAFAGGLGGRWRRRRKQRDGDPATLSRNALAEMDAADNPKDAAAAAERAVHHAIEAATGLKSRGLLREALGAKLVEAGVAEGLARDVVVLLERCSDLRFDPSPSEEIAEALASESKALVRALL